VNFLVLVLSLLALGILLAAGGMILSGQIPDDVARGEAFESVVRSIPDPASRPPFRAQAHESGRRLEAVFGRYFGRDAGALGPLVHLSALRAQVAGRWLPVAGPFLFTAFALGLGTRERKRVQMSYSSATLSYLGKFVFALSTAAFLLTGFLPADVPVGFLYASTATGGAGLYLYVSQIPPKI
jgi:hypothetical protein